MPARNKDYWDRIKVAARTLDKRSRNLFLIMRAQHSEGGDNDDCLFSPSGVYNYGLTAEIAEEILERFILLCSSRLLEADSREVIRTRCLTESMV